MVTVQHVKKNEIYLKQLARRADLSKKAAGIAKAHIIHGSNLI